MRGNAQQRSAQKEESDSQTCTGADSQHERPGQRISEKRLHEQAACGESDSGKKSDKGLDESYLEDDVTGQRFAGSAGHQIPDIPHTDADSTGGQIADKKSDHEDRQRSEKEFSAD